MYYNCKKIKKKIMLPKIYFTLLIIGIFGFSIHAQQTTETFTTPGSDTFTVPVGVSQITVEAWGAGGRGGSRVSGNNQSYGGGGGGAYSISTIVVSAGDEINYTVGAGSTSPSPGGNSEAFLNTSTTAFLRAVGGESVPNNSSTGANGGLTGNIGDISYIGGNGADAIGSNGGGGGSSAGSTANGNNATDFNGAAAPFEGGNGGNGIQGAGDGSPGISPGGGGGGARRQGGSASTGGRGADGQIVITYTINTNNPPAINLVTPTSTNITITEGDTVNFEWTATDSDGTIVSGTWRPNASTAFTNATGSPGAGPFTASQVYNTAGTFTARVQVEDDDAASAFIDITVDVQAPQACDGNVFTSAFTATTDVLAEYIETPEQLNLYTAGSDVYSFGVGQDNNLLLEAFQATNSISLAIEKLADRVELRRAGTAGQGSNGEERHILFFEQDATYSGSTKNFKGEFFELMENALVDTSINRGSDNVFNNQGGSNVNNIERIDYIFEDGIVVPDPPSEGGFPVFERGGNDDFTFGVISQLDASLDPSEYNTIITFDAVDWEPTGSSITASVLSGFPKNNGNLIETADLSNQDLDIIFVSFDDMGLSAGDIIYGYSLAGGDVTTDCTEFLDFNNPSFFPQNTGSSNGGLDLLSGGSFSKTAFIHTSTGWYQGDDPNLVTTDCDDTIIVNGGIATITSDKTFGELSGAEGTLDLSNNTMSLCGDINSILPFKVESGTIRMIGTDKQFIAGQNEITVDELDIDNTNGVEVETDLNIEGVLNVENGDFTTNNNVLLPCFFTEPTTGDFENGDAGQIGPIGINASIIGDVQVEQCYPGRRSFRLVSSSTTTTSSIQDNWQENATAYNNIPVPSTTQEDGIPYGFGTHITGVTHGNGNAVGQQNLDQTNGLDWQPSGNASMFEFDEGTQSFDAVLVTESSSTPQTATLEAGKPYFLMIRGSREVNLVSNASSTYNTKLRSSGSIEQGDKVQTSSVGTGEYILIGNPYHAIVNLATVVSNSSGVSNNAWFYDPTAGGMADVNPNSQTLGGRGAYVSIDLGNPSTFTANVNQYLQAYQGVWLQATAGTQNIEFSQNDKAVDQTQLDVFNSSDNNMIKLSMYDQDSYAAGNTADDRLIVLFDRNYNNSVDTEDAVKFNNPDENIGILIDNSLLSIEKRALPQADDILEIFADDYRSTDYVFVVQIDGLTNHTVYLYDNYTDTETLLNNDVSTAVNFSVDSSIAESVATDRFELRFQTSTLGTDDFDAEGISVYPNPASTILNVDFGLNIGRFNSLELFDISGRLVRKQSISNQLEQTQLDVSAISSGVYLLKVSSNREQFSTKLIIK
jgi:hypothetical protein